MTFSRSRIDSAQARLTLSFTNTLITASQPVFQPVVNTVVNTQCCSQGLVVEDSIHRQGTFIETMPDEHADESTPSAAANGGADGLPMWRVWFPWLGAAAITSAATVAAVSRWQAARAAAQWERHRSEVLSLYKQIMRAAFEWPSIKKEAVVHEIRDAFRSGAGEQDPRKVHAMLAEAHAGLKELCQGVAARQRLRATPSVPKWIPRDNWRTWADDGAGSSSAESEPGRAAETWAFDELGVSPSVSMSEAKLAYHEKAKACHPDSGTPCSANDEAFKRLQKAWEHVRKHLLREQQGSRFR